MASPRASPRERTQQLHLLVAVDKCTPTWDMSPLFERGPQGQLLPSSRVFRKVNAAGLSLYKRGDELIISAPLPSWCPIAAVGGAVVGTDKDKAWLESVLYDDHVPHTGKLHVALSAQAAGRISTGGKRPAAGGLQPSDDYSSSEEEEDDEVDPPRWLGDGEWRSATGAQTRLRIATYGSAVVVNDVPCVLDGSPLTVQLEATRPPLGASVEFRTQSDSEPGAKRRSKATWTKGSVTAVDSDKHTVTVQPEGSGREPITLPSSGAHLRFDGKLARRRAGLVLKGEHHLLFDGAHYFREAVPERPPPTTGFLLAPYVEHGMVLARVCRGLLPLQPASDSGDSATALRFKLTCNHKRLVLDAALLVLKKVRGGSGVDVFRRFGRGDAWTQTGQLASNKHLRVNLPTARLEQEQTVELMLVCKGGCSFAVKYVDRASLRVRSNNVAEVSCDALQSERPVSADEAANGPWRHALPAGSMELRTVAESAEKISSSSAAFADDALVAVASYGMSRAERALALSVLPRRVRLTPIVTTKATDAGYDEHRVVDDVLRNGWCGMPLAIDVSRCSGAEIFLVADIHQRDEDKSLPDEQQLALNTIVPVPSERQRRKLKLPTLKMGKDVREAIAAKHSNVLYTFVRITDYVLGGIICRKRVDARVSAVWKPQAGQPLWPTG